MIRAIVAGLAAFGILWALTSWLVGGFVVSLPWGTIRSHDPLRPLLVGAAAATAYFALGGRLHLQRAAVPLAVVLSLSTAAAGIAHNSWTAGGSDSYAYVSQADLWLTGNLTVDVPLAGSAPWPDAVWTFAPHGFRPAVSGPAIVPVTAPGLPLLMAAAKAIAGHCAMFLVTPLGGALLVWATFILGRRIRSAPLGLAAAWLVATSPAVLAMLVSPMSDVPAAAFWTAAIYGLLGTSARSAWVAGVSAAIAILIRPNLVPLAALLVLWKFWTTRNLKAVVPLAMTTIAACLFIARTNNALYGSPLASGYGSLAALYSASNIAINVQRYGGWLVETQTPLAALGFAALIFPARVVWRSRDERNAARLLGAGALVVWGLYLIYTPYEAWWFLRFLLPSWPAICIGTAALVLRLTDVPRRSMQVVAWTVLAALGLYGLRYAAQHGAFPSGEGDHRYVSIAKIVEAETPPSAVIFTGQNSGPIRYYGGRTIVRFDLLAPSSFAEAVRWLDTQGREPFFLLEDWEMPAFEERFGAIRLAPIVTYRAPGVPGVIFLFDPRRPDSGPAAGMPPASARAKCVAPSPLLHLR
jgi:hypothetical protein